jgi:hypothetical protein
MKIKEESIKNLHLKGIYSITSQDGKRYIGSTQKSFQGRLKTHFEKLRSSNHTNKYLQNSYNKYKDDYFIFEILEVLEEDFQEREKYWIDFYESWIDIKGYNLIKNPCKAPSSDEKSRKKISETLKRKFKSGELSLNSGNWIKGQKPWNKGKKYKSTEHLKVKKGFGRRCKDNNNQALLKSEELLETPIIERHEDNQQPSN